MSYQNERDEFMAHMGQEGMPASVARRLLSKSATLARLAVAQCNGDYPADNGERSTAECPECGLNWAPEAIHKQGCVKCVARAHVLDIMARLDLPGFGVTFNSDPRGYAVLVKVPSGRTTDWGQRGIGVPTRV